MVVAARYPILARNSDSYLMRADHRVMYSSPQYANSNKEACRSHDPRAHLPLDWMRRNSFLSNHCPNRRNFRDIEANRGRCNSFGIRSSHHRYPVFQFVVPYICGLRSSGLRTLEAAELRPDRRHRVEYVFPRCRSRGAANSRQTAFHGNCADCRHTPSFCMDYLVPAAAENSLCIRCRAGTRRRSQRCTARPFKDRYCVGRDLPNCNVCFVSRGGFCCCNNHDAVDWSLSACHTASSRFSLRHTDVGSANRGWLDADRRNKRI